MRSPRNAVYGLKTTVHAIRMNLFMNVCVMKRRSRESCLMKQKQQQQNSRKHFRIR